MKNGMYDLTNPKDILSSTRGKETVKRMLDCAMKEGMINIIKAKEHLAAKIKKGEHLFYEDMWTEIAGAPDPKRKEWYVTESFTMDDFGNDINDEKKHHKPISVFIKKLQDIIDFYGEENVRLEYHEAEHEWHSPTYQLSVFREETDEEYQKRLGSKILHAENSFKHDMFHLKEIIARWGLTVERIHELTDNAFKPEHYHEREVN